MTATSDETSLLDDVILNEDDLTEEAKTRFAYHSDILNAFEVYRQQILLNKCLSPLNRHKLFSISSDWYAKSKQVLNYMAENNEVLSCNLPPMGPVIICGLPRTGTTLLYNLLACDPRCRAPLFTDMSIAPTPPIARSNPINQDRRKALASSLQKTVLNKTDGTGNNFQSIHPSFAIEEDYLILCHAGCMVFRLPLILHDQSKFSDCLSNEMNKDFAYDYHEVFLRMLNSVDAPSSHWLLKAPAHIFYLDTLLRHYPNAKLIMTHRSMIEVLPSFYRMMVGMEKFLLIETISSSDREVIMTQYTQLFDKMVECLLKFRSTQSEKNVFDVKYDDLMEQPIDTIRRIYDRFGLEWSDEFEIGMQSWLRDNPQGKQGRHTYSLDDFGLTSENIDVRYAEYINLFLRSSISSDTTH